MHDLPPLPWLRAFEVSARHLSFTSAARELALSQAAVSKQIKLLELKLGEPLFHRLPRSLGLTKAGKAFLPKVQDAFERLAAGAGEVFGPRRPDVLAIRCAIGFAVNWLAPRLPDFMARNPGVALRLISSVWNEDGGSEAFDLDIRYGDGRWPGVTSERLTRESLRPVCSPALIESGRLKTPSDLADHLLIHVLGYKEGWALWLKKAGAKHEAAVPGLQCDTSLMAFELAAQSAGVALGRTSMIGPDLKSGRLAAPFALAVPVDEGFYLVSGQARENGAHAAAFREWVLGLAEQSLGRRAKPDDDEVKAIPFFQTGLISP
jgi:LysR family transcriptional regulator, glycine cleavage system transcriptional activator